MSINRKLFLEEKIGLLLLKFSAPASFGMIVLAISGLVDTIFMGKLVGTLAIAALTLSLPIFMLFSATAATIGIGGAAVWSVDMGAQKELRANKVFANSMLAVVIISIVMSVLGIFFIDKILQFLNTPSDVYPFARDYLYILFLGSTPIIYTIANNNFIRAEGMPKTAMTTVFIAVTTNILFDFIFIYYMKLGVKGCALATLLAYSLSSLFIIYHFTLGKTKIKVLFKDFLPDIAILIEICKIGTASFLRQISIGIMHYMMNFSVVLYAGTNSGLYLAIVGISLRLIMLVLMPVIGVIQGMQPIIGFNFGAKHYGRARETIILAIFSAAFLAFSFWIIIMIFPRNLLAIFSNDIDLINHGENIVRFIIAALPFVAAQTTGAGLFQILKKPIQAGFFAILRQVIILCPVILILPLFLGLNGVWYAVPLSDLLACLITGIWVYREIALLKKLQKAGP